MLMSTIFHVQSAHIKVVGKGNIADAALPIASIHNIPHSFPAIHHHHTTSALPNMWPCSCGGGGLVLVPPNSILSTLSTCCRCTRSLSRILSWSTSMMPTKCIGWSSSVFPCHSSSARSSKWIRSSAWWRAASSALYGCDRIL